jgi:hypothetical protein
MLEWFVLVTKIELYSEDNVFAHEDNDVDGTVTVTGQKTLSSLYNNRKWLYS